MIRFYIHSVQKSTRIEIDLCAGKVYEWLKELNEKMKGRKWYQSIGLALNYSRWDFQTNRCTPHPVRSLKLLSEPCFCYLNTTIFFKRGINIGQRHSSHIIHFTTVYIFAANREDGKNWLSIICICSINATNLSDVCINGKKLIPSFEWCTVAWKFPRFIHKPHTQYR